MNRQDFGKWGIELKPEEFAGALAFLLHEFYLNTPPEILAKFIGVKEFDRNFREIEINNPIPLCFDSTYHFSAYERHLKELDYILFDSTDHFNYFSNLFSADERYRQWQELISNLKQWHPDKNTTPFHLRIELYTNPENAFWLTEQLSLLNKNEVSVYLRTDEPTTEVGWKWALRVGFLKDENSQRLRDELEKYIEKERTWIQPLVEFINLDSENDNCDLLLIPNSLMSALNSALNLNIKISADCILIIGQTNEKPENIPSLIDTFRRLINTAGVGIVNVKPENRMSWFAELIRGLSHNEPLDVALFAACREIKTSIPFLIASRQLIEFSRLAESIKSLGKKIIRKDFHEESFDVTYEDAANFEIDTGLYSSNEFGRILSHRSDKFNFDQESTSATSAARINRRVERMSKRAKKTKENQSRWIQSQIYDVSRQNERIRLLRALRANAAHEAVVRIGTESLEWTQNKEEFRAELLPPDKESYELTVVFTEPQLFTEAQVSSVILPPEGDSTQCSFFFYVKENIERIEARISILYKNRVLQTALLKASVSPELLEISDKFKIEIMPEAIVRADFSGLKERRYFDAAFILNKDVNNAHGITAIKDKYVSFSTPEGLDEFNNRIDRFLEEIADSPERYAGQLDTPATVRLLRSLAEYGHDLYDSMLDHQDGNSPLNLSKIIVGLSDKNPADNTPKRIQIVSAKPDTRLPFEFLYDRPSPQSDDAGLCPKVIEGLDQGRCPTDCEGIKNPENYVCPLGFWGVSNIIERHTHNIVYTNETVRGDFSFQAETLENREHLDVFRKVLFAASDKADVLEENVIDGKTELKKGGVEKIISVLKTITESDISKISSWEEWREKIESDAPSALILLTHTEQTSSGKFALEIEDGQPPDKLLKSSSIEAQYVRFPEQNLPPIVFLLGCKTGAAKIDFTSFVTKFRQKGAAIIVSTGASIRGRHAIPVAEQLLKSLKEFTGQPNVSFGEVMRQVKQKMLARGYPMVLTLMTYGDADWQIGINKE